MSDRPARILLVDDEQPIQTLLSFPLQRDGYVVVAASDGREALARFGEQSVDLVVLDVMLPNMDGLEVCRRLRALSPVPIIMLTAKSEEIDKVLGLELDADDYKILGGYLVARALTARVMRLEQAARKVAGGDYSNPIHADSEDELGRLAAAFDDMQRQLARLDYARCAQAVHRPGLARAAHAAVLPRRLPRAARGRGARRVHAPPSFSAPCAPRSSACASSRWSCSTSRGWRPARSSCARSRPT